MKCKVLFHKQWTANWKLMSSKCTKIMKRIYIIYFNQTDPILFYLYTNSDKSISLSARNCLSKLWGLTWHAATVTNTSSFVTFIWVCEFNFILDLISIVSFPCSHVLGQNRRESLIIGNHFCDVDTSCADDKNPSQLPEFPGILSQSYNTSINKVCLGTNW